MTVKLSLYHYLSLLFQFCVIPESTMKVTKDTVTISDLKYLFGSKGHTVQPKENWGFLLKICPPLPKVRLRLWNVISNTFLDFGFGTKRHMVEI